MCWVPLVIFASPHSQFSPSSIFTQKELRESRLVLIGWLSNFFKNSPEKRRAQHTLEETILLARPQAIVGRPSNPRRCSSQYLVHLQTTTITPMMIAHPRVSGGSSGHAMGRTLTSVLPANRFPTVPRLWLKVSLMSAMPFCFIASLVARVGNGRAKVWMERLERKMGETKRRKALEGRRYRGMTRRPWSPPCCEMRTGF